MTGEKKTILPTLTTMFLFGLCPPSYAVTPRAALSVGNHASVSLWTKLFRDYVKLGSFSDNITETRIKSSRFKSHKGRDGGREKRFTMTGMGFYSKNQLNVFTRFPCEVFYCPAAIIKRLCVQWANNTVCKYPLMKSPIIRAWC